MPITQDNVKKQAHLHWSSSSRNEQPCFCHSIIDLNLDRLQATPETLAAIFGIEVASSVQVCILGTTEPLSLITGTTSSPDNEDNNHDDPYWPLEADQHYQVSSSILPDAKVVPIKDIFLQLPGDTPDEKSDRLQALSNHFYNLIWKDPTVPPDFHEKFHYVLSSAKIQAFRQYDWLFQVFGGPEACGEMTHEKHLLPKVMAKHTKSRMTLAHSVTWLQLMARSIDDVLGQDGSTDLIHALRLYWLHFYGFFPFNEEERRELRRVVFEKSTMKT